MSLFDDTAGPDVFRDRDVLLDEHVPDELVAREEQIDEYLRALRPVYDGHQPEHVFLFGPNGSGKTAATRFMLRELRSSDESDVDLSSVWVRCNGVGTDYMLAIKLANKILPSDEQLNRGHPEDVVYDRLFDALEGIGGTIIVVLDEISRIEDLDTFMYEVTRARSAGGRLTDAKVGVIGISTNSDFYEDLSNDVKSSLDSETIDFGKYDADGLRSILERRVDVAFEPEAVDDDVPALCAAHGAKLSGDARFALDLLRKAGDLAKHDADERVTTEHVRRAKDKVLESRVEKLTAKLNPEGKQVAYALAVLHAKGTDHPRTKEVYEQYVSLAESRDSSPIVSVQATEYLNQMDEIGLTEIEKNTGAGGRFNRHALRYDVESVIGALEDFIVDSGVLVDQVASLVDNSEPDDDGYETGVEA